MSPQEPLAYTIPEAAALIKISEPYAYALARDGRLPTVLIGRRRVVPATRLKAWIDQLSEEQQL
jgi:excisionase family DNA binding protein